MWSSTSSSLRVGALVVLLFAFGCGDRTLVAFPGAALTDVLAASNRLSDDLVYDNGTELPSQLLHSEFDRVRLGAGSDSLFEFEDVVARVWVVRGVVVEVTVRAAEATQPPSLFEAVRSIVSTLKSKGWREFDPDRPIPSLLTPDLFTLRAGESEQDPTYRFLGSLSNDDGITAALEMHRFSPVAAALDLRFELPRTDEGGYLLP